MGYFDDLIFVSAVHAPHCRAVIDQRFPGIYSLEFMRSGRMHLGLDGGWRRTVAEPVAFWHHPAHTYQYGAVDENGWDRHWVLLRGSRARRLVEEGLQPLSANGFVAVREAAAFADAMLALIRLVQERDPRRQGERVILLERLLYLLQSQSAAMGSGASGLEELAQQIAIDPCRAYDFVVEAQRRHLSYSHFRRLFRSRIGQAPHDYLLQCRVRQAGRLLRESALSIQEVSYACGYDDPAQFSRLFRIKMGLSPRHYRRLK